MKEMKQENMKTRGGHGKKNEGNCGKKDKTRGHEYKGRSCEEKRKKI